MARLMTMMDFLAWTLLRWCTARRCMEWMYARRRSDCSLIALTAGMGGTDHRAHDCVSVARLQQQHHMIQHFKTVRRTSQLRCGLCATQLYEAFDLCSRS